MFVKRGVIKKCQSIQNGGGGQGPWSSYTEKHINVSTGIHPFGIRQSNIDHRQDKRRDFRYKHFIFDQEIKKLNKKLA